jgi:PQQ-dependent catabolism-associated CXXCW motif protein
MPWSAVRCRAFFVLAAYDVLAALAGLIAIQGLPPPQAVAGDESFLDPPPAANAAPAAELEGYKLSDYRDPVPAALKGAKVLSKSEAEDHWARKAAVFIDVYPKPPKPENLPVGTIWREPQHQTIEGAYWLPNVGYGVLAPHVEAYFKRALDTLSSGDKAKPLLFYCLRNCWMSWNSAKRAMSYGYTNILWFPEGTDGWQEIGYPILDVKAYE